MYHHAGDRLLVIELLKNILKAKSVNSFKEPHEIYTDRLLITPLKVTECGFILELLNSEGFIRFIGDRNVRTLDEALAYVEKVVSNIDINYWVVTSRINAEPMGVVSLVKRDYLDFQDIGFAFLPRFYRQGYAEEAVRAVFDFILDRTTSPEILANPMPENVASINLLKKLGLRFSTEMEHDGKAMHIYRVNTDQLKIDALMRVFYGMFDNRNGRQVDWEKLMTLCIPEVRIICHKQGATEISDLASFIEPRKDMLRNGGLTEFQEEEVSAQTIVLTGIAHRHSHYKKSGVSMGIPFAQTGQKFLQFVKIHATWKISSFIWEDHRES